MSEVPPWTPNALGLVGCLCEGGSEGVFSGFGKPPLIAEVLLSFGLLRRLSSIRGTNVGEGFCGEYRISPQLLSLISHSSDIR